MTYLNNLTPLTFKEDMAIIIGISKGTYVGMEPLPTKQELIDELTEEMAVMPSSEAGNYRQYILTLQKMTDNEFLIYYEKVAPLELKNVTIVAADKPTQAP